MKWYNDELAKEWWNGHFFSCARSQRWEEGKTKSKPTSLSDSQTEGSILFSPELTDSWVWDPVSLVESRMIYHSCSNFEEIGECNVRVEYCLISCPWWWTYWWTTVIFISNYHSYLWTLYLSHSLTKLKNFLHYSFAPIISAW